MANMLSGRLLFVLAMVLGFYAILACSGEVPEESLRERFGKWKSLHGRKYENSDEEKKRFVIFKNNVKYIESFNNNGSNSYKLAINQFADWTEREIRRANYGFGKLGDPATSSSTPFRYADVDINDVPASMNWVDMGAVTEVKNQGSCNCCWAFSSVGAMEGIVEIVTGQLISLSEQELVDCMAVNQGCDPNWMEHAFDFIISNNGLDTESDYPYQGTEGTCNVNAVSAAAITGYEFVPSNNETALLLAAANQPISVAIDASDPAFVNYPGGVFNGPCGTQLTHAVTLVGYGTADDGTDYWLIKNSWGTLWGEEGYMRIQRGVEAAEGLCGIAMHALYPTLN